MPELKASKTQIDKVASVTHNIPLGPEVEITSAIPVEEGTVLALRALEETDSYSELELPTGRLSKILEGDVFVGVLGQRRALRGIVGDIPDSIEVGDTLHVLNMGGVVGKSTSSHMDVGKPVSAEVLGAVIHNGLVANIRDYAIPHTDVLNQSVPIVAISGTCMDSGKTTAACVIVKTLSKAGMKIGVAKVTGVATQRDTLKMMDYGAREAFNFGDAGLPSTTDPARSLTAALGLIQHLNTTDIDVIVLEFGDGIIGGYSVEHILRSQELLRHVKTHVVASNDIMAAWGAIEFLKRYDIRPSVITGPATDNKAGIDYIEEHFDIPASNAYFDHSKLTGVVMKSLGMEVPK